MRLHVVDPDTFLRDQLLEGPRHLDDLVAAAKQVGLGRTSVLKAVSRLRVEARRGAVWSLPDVRARTSASEPMWRSAGTFCS